MLLLGGRSACVSLDSAVVNAKCVRVCAWARVCVCGVNRRGGQHWSAFRWSDSAYEAVRALHAAK